ncbi:MAG: hypothetical protein ABJN39_19820 [Sulfitobacter sp.]|uniref:hypothetical protein n=1 Tax=Alphaproteobacteria TaxID=28211 RepID=UPI002942798E|nr:hypothetical protein [Sulfitobacter sp. LC.270.F.C4]WOI15231.1 hypothetical protein R1T45_19495 [Sulfitobacter sp. LC.270.F.C4]
MFDYVPTESRDESFVLASCLFSEHGHELAEAAAMLGGASAEAKVVSCALQIVEAGTITPHIEMDLITLFRLFSLERVGDPECIETMLFLGISPSSPQVETICLLTDMLANILDAIDVAALAHCPDVVADQPTTV